MKQLKCQPSPISVCCGYNYICKYLNFSYQIWLNVQDCGEYIFFKGIFQVDSNIVINLMFLEGIEDKVWPQRKPGYFGEQYWKRNIVT